MARLHNCTSKVFCEQKDGIVTGSILALIVANYFVEDSEHQALNVAAKKPSCQ
jgi:hypothetical protein